MRRGDVARARPSRARAVVMMMRWESDVF